jgi:hypothetical protein
MRRSHAVAAVFIAASCSPTVPSGYSPAGGDVVFQSLPRSNLVDAIEGATQSPLSHCGIVVARDGEYLVLEAFGSVRETPLANWIARGREQAFVASRLSSSLASDAASFVAAAQRMTGQPYDFSYAFDNGAIYCSELVYLAFKETYGRPIGGTTRLKDLNWKPFESFISESEGGDVPLEREMITPRALHEAPELTVVFRQGLEEVASSVK